MNSSDDQLTAELYQREVEGWENFRHKRRHAYADGYADDAAGYDLTGTGLKDKAAAVSDIDLATVTQYEMHDFRAHHLSDDVALAHYFARFSGNAKGRTFEVNMFIGGFLCGVKAAGCCGGFRTRRQRRTPGLAEMTVTSAQVQALRGQARKIDL